MQEANVRAWRCLPEPGFVHMLDVQLPNCHPRAMNATHVVLLLVWKYRRLSRVNGVLLV